MMSQSPGSASRLAARDSACTAPHVTVCATGDGGACPACTVDWIHCSSGGWPGPNSYCCADSRDAPVRFALPPCSACSCTPVNGKEAGGGRPACSPTQSGMPANCDTRPESEAACKRCASAEKKRDGCMGRAAIMACSTDATHATRTELGSPDLTIRTCACGAETKSGGPTRPRASSCLPVCEVSLGWIIAMAGQKKRARTEAEAPADNAGPNAAAAADRRAGMADIARRYDAALCS
jgi:hypothetical protein